MSKNAQCVGHEEFKCSEYELDSDICDYSCGEGYQFCIHPIIVKLSESRTDALETPKHVAIIEPGDDCDGTVLCCTIGGRSFRGYLKCGEPKIDNHVVSYHYTLIASAIPAK